MEVSLKKILLPNFINAWHAIRSMSKTFYVFKGGRNSAKSTHISIFCLLILMMFPVSGLAIRKVANTLDGSVFEQLKEAANILGIEDQFVFLKNPLKVIYKARGNYIIFRGADDPKKIKSIKSSKFPIAFTWIEELDEFKTEDEVQTIVDSILRDQLPEGIKYWVFYSYNPPKRKQHYINKKYETQFINDNTFIHVSDYRDNKYLSHQTLEEIKLVKENNERKYNWVYLGKPIGGGIVPFDNLVFREIKDEEISTFDNIRQGNDWGYSVDPMAWVRWHYDKKHNKIYAMDEIYQIKLYPEDLARKIKEKKGDTDLTLCGHDQPSSRDEVQYYGCNFMSIKGGPGSIEVGENWLDSLSEIVIDPLRTPNIASEFENIDYQVDKDGYTMSKLEDKNNHAIDATRYAFENDSRKNIITIM
jgi:PBSX family phage terminase large subunit